MILPIGRYLGGTPDGDHQVRRGGETHRLDAMSFAAWGLGHGPVDPVLAAGGQWTREELVRYAGLAGLPGSAGLVADLLEWGLLVEVAPDGTGAAEFARSHRAVPLAMGLGNTAEQPDTFTIGFFDRGLLQVDELRYEVWCWSTVYDDLWQVCHARASAAEPERLLEHFLAGVHRLASASALYLDVVDR